MSYFEHQDAIRVMLRRASLTAVDDSGDQQILSLDGLAGDKLAKIVRVQPHGLSSTPPMGAEGLMLALGGRADRTMAFGFEHRAARPRNQPQGTATLYDDQGNTIFMASANGIKIKSGTLHVTVTPGPGKQVYLGGDPSVDHGTYAPVATTQGPSTFVQARIA